VDLRLYKNVAFTMISVAVLLNSMCGWGSGFLQTILLQRLLDYTPAQAGFVILPGALGMACMTLLAGRLTDKLDRRYVVLFGLGMFIVTSYWFSFLTLDKPMSWVLWMTVWRYISMGFLFTPMNTAALAALPPEKMRMGSGLITIVQQGIGGTMSIAGLTTILQHRTAYHATMLDQQQALSLLGMGELLAPVRDIVSRAGAIGAAVDAQALDALRQYLEQQATVAAYQDCFFLLAALGVIMVPLVCFLRR
jgi:DHA2 family multidrug resistance protein